MLDPQNGCRPADPTARPDPRLPVVVVTGWHSTGKSSLVRDMAVALDEPLAVVQGGFAGLRHPSLAERVELLAVEEEVVELEPGCPCCAVRLDLVRVISALADRRRPPSRVIVELTGDADVVTVLQTALGDADLRRAAVVDSVITVVDGEAMARRALGPGGHSLPVAVIDQVAVADHVVVHGAGRLSPHALDGALWLLRGINRTAAISLGRPRSMADLVGFGAFAPARVEQRLTAHRHPASPGTGELQHLSVTLPGELDPDRLDTWLNDLHRHHGPGLLRMHAVLAIRGEEHRWVASGARATLEVADGTQQCGALPASRLELVARDLDAGAAAAALKACVAP